MTMPLSPAPVPAPASAIAPSTTGDTSTADNSAADGSFSSVFDAATKSPDNTAGKSSDTNTKDAADDKAGKHSSDADASTAAAAASGLPIVPYAAALSPATPVHHTAADDGAASPSPAAIANGVQSRASMKTPAAATASVTGSGAAADPDAASAPSTTTAARPPISGGRTAKNVFMPQAVNAADTDTAHGAHDAKELAAALTTATLRSGAGSSPAPGAAPAMLMIHGGVQAPQQNAPVAVQHIAAPVGSAPWHDEVAHGLLHVITLHQQHAELHVNPPHLGPIDVHIHVAADQAAVTFTASHADTRAALEQAMPRLRDMLSGQGIFLGQAAVQSDSQPHRGPAQDHRAPRRIAATGTAAAAAPIRVVHYFARSDRIVDTFA